MTGPLHPHPSAEPFLSLLLVLTEIDFCLDLQVNQWGWWPAQGCQRGALALSWPGLMVLTLLCLQNCSFLDESWLLPVRARGSQELSFRHLALPEKSNEQNKEGFGGQGLPRTPG